jgi:hypothetical protein
VALLEGCTVFGESSLQGLTHSNSLAVKGSPYYQEGIQERTGWMQNQSRTLQLLGQGKCTGWQDVFGGSIGRSGRAGMYLKMEWLRIAMRLREGASTVDTQGF